MRYYLQLLFLVGGLFNFANVAYCDEFSSSPEASGAPAPTFSPPTATPAPTPMGNCPEGQKWDFADGRCKECMYAITNFRESFVSDGDPSHTVGLDGIEHWQAATFGPNDVVLGTGSPDNSTAFREIQNFLDNSISACYQPDPNLDGIDTPWDTGWNAQYSQCVAYRAFERYHLFEKNPDDTWSEAQDPTYSFQFRVPAGHRWWFGDIKEMWVKNANGDLVRTDLPNGAYFEEDKHGMFISYFDKDGNRLDPTTILDPSYTAGAPVDPATDPNFANDHTPRPRSGLDKTVCYTWEVRGIASPISLFMPGCDYRELEPTIVKFPLNPHNENSYTVWNASKCMPLLVYDPTHSGQITSGKQLLGDWTYGGAPTYDGRIKPWKHGFQVLATFDTDGDGIVSGKELSSLSVWSDDNENGISEPGEVRTTDDFGVKQLRYQAPKNFRHGDLFVESGYKLKRDDKVVDGMLIDWYAQTAPSENELVPRLPFNAVTTDSSPINKYRRSCSSKDLQGFAGGWRWWLNSDSKKVTRGYLTLGQSTDNTLVGNTFSIQTAKKKGTNLDLMLASWPLKAVVRDREATLSIPSGRGNVISDVKLSDDGKRMTGTTKSTSGDGKSSVYSWTAERSGCRLK